MDRKVPADGDTAEKNAAAIAELKAKLAVGQTALSKHLQQKRASQMSQRSDGADRAKA